MFMIHGQMTMQNGFRIAVGKNRADIVRIDTVSRTRQVTVIPFMTN